MLYKTLVLTSLVCVSLSQPYLEHPLVPLNEIVTEPVEKQNPRNTTESPSPTRMVNKGPQPPVMKMENVEIEMEMFPYTRMTEEDLADRWSNASSVKFTERNTHVANQLESAFV